MAGWGLGMLLGDSAVTCAPKQEFLIWVLWTLLKIAILPLTFYMKIMCLGIFLEGGGGPCTQLLRSVSALALTSGQEPKGLRIR